MTYQDHRARLFEAFSPTLFTIEWVDYQVANGALLFWGIADAAILAQVRTYPTGAKIMHGVAAAGELNAIVDLIALAEDNALDRGCIGACIESRAGWKRTLAQAGYEEDKILLRKVF